MNITLTFPHPPRVLSPNGRVPLTKAAAVKLNFAKVAAKKKTRDSAYMTALAAIRAHEAAIDDEGFNERAEQAYREGISLKQFLDDEATRAKGIAKEERRGGE